MNYEHILDALEVDLEPFALCEIGGEGSIRLGRRKHAVLHYVLAGEGRVHIDGRPPLAVEAGTLILVPAFSGHSMSARGGRAHDISPCQPVDAAMLHLKNGSGSPSLTAICGRVAIVYRGLGGTMDLIREPLVQKMDAQDRVRQALDELVAELASPMIGSRALARSIFLQSLILLIRRRLQAEDLDISWMRGLADETLWNALRAMLDRPGADHTVDSLAELTAMSRARFALRFQKAFGSGPIELLKCIRMRRAAELLANSALPVKSVASTVGYRSRSYFSRAFKAEHGLSPDAFRAGLETV